MATQETDNFTSGGRTAGSGVPTVGTTITWWSPASNGDPWVAQAATSTFSFSGTQGQTTGTTTANVATLNGSISGITKKWYDSLQSARFQKTAVLDGCALVARFQDINNFYRAEVQNNALNIVKLVSGTATTLATIPFTDGGAKFWIKLFLEGFGLNNTAVNLKAEAYLDGNSDPGFQISAIDGSLTQPGLVGVRLKGSTGGQTQSVDSFLAVDPAQYTPAPQYNTLVDLPYGTTLNVANANPPPLPQQTLLDLQGIGNGATLRWQQQQGTINTALNFYNWAILDDCVYRCNQAGIRVWLPLQGFASWLLTRDGYGNNCTLSAAVAAGTPLTQISVTSLVAGTFIPNGGQLLVESGGAHPETVTINNVGGYVAGATLLTINSWTPSFAHAIGAQIYEATAGAVLPNATDVATFAGLVAARYNGLNGYGKIETIQIYNEEADAQTRVGAQSASWDNGGAILAPVYVAAWTAIKAVYPGCVVMAGAVRNSPATSLTHQQNWLSGFFAGVKALGGSVDAIDAHEYRDGVVDWNGTPVPDPTLNTFVSNGGPINRPNIGLKLFTMRQYAQIYGFNSALNIGEFGSLVYDDNSGFTSATNLTITKNVAISSITVASLAQNIPNATPLFIDTGGANPEGPIYAYGQAALSGSPVTIQITTNAAGNSQAQAQWTPTQTHNQPVNIYAALGGIAQSQTQDMLYSKAMYDAGMANNAAHILRFTNNSLSSVTVGNVPQNVAGATGAPRSWTQSLSGVYTYLPGYYMTKLYAQQFMTRVWQAQYYHSLPLQADIGSLPLASTANPGLISLTAPTP